MLHFAPFALKANRSKLQGEKTTTSITELKLFDTKNCCITKEPVLERKRQSRMAGSFSNRLYVAKTIEKQG